MNYNIFRHAKAIFASTWKLGSLTPTLSIVFHTFLICDARVCGIWMFSWEIYLQCYETYGTLRTIKVSSLFYINLVPAPSNWSNYSSINNFKLKGPVQIAVTYHRQLNENFRLLEWNHATSVNDNELRMKLPYYL